jgi:hypothetical protein
MNLPHMRKLLCLLCASLFFYLPAKALNDLPDNPNDGGRVHTIPPNRRHGGARAGLGIQLKVAPVVHPPRHKDPDEDNRENKDRGEAAVIYNLSPSPERFSIIRETRTMLLDNGKQEQVQTTTVVEK